VGGSSEWSQAAGLPGRARSDDEGRAPATAGWDRGDQPPRRRGRPGGSHGGRPAFRAACTPPTPSIAAALARPRSLPHAATFLRPLSEVLSEEPPHGADAQPRGPPSSFHGKSFRSRDQHRLRRGRRAGGLSASVGRDMGSAGPARWRGGGLYRSGEARERSRRTPRGCQETGPHAWARQRSGRVPDPVRSDIRGMTLAVMPRGRAARCSRGRFAGISPMSALRTCSVCWLRSGRWTSPPPGRTRACRDAGRIAPARSPSHADPPRARRTRSPPRT
jgi:hypothetical protein